MNKGLEALKDMCDINSPYIIDKIKQDYLTIEKELKALEILRHKTLISFHDIKVNENLKEFNDYIERAYGYKSPHRLTQEEYDLLKEVLL